MAKELLRRKSSIPSYLHGGENSVEVADRDLRWRRSSHAAISAMLPSHGAFHSDAGLILSRSLTDPQRRKSIMNRRKSLAAVSVPVTEADVPSSLSTCRVKGVDGFGQMMVGEETECQTIHSIKGMTATISVKRKYSVHASPQGATCRPQPSSLQKQNVSVPERQKNEYDRRYYSNISEDIIPTDQGQRTSANWNENDSVYKRHINISKNEMYETEQFVGDNRQLVHSAVSATRSGLQRSNDGLDNPGFEMEPDYEDLVTARPSRRLKFGRKSRKQPSRSAHNGLKNYNDGGKTLIIRRTTVVRSLSERIAAPEVRQKSSKHNSELTTSGKYQDVDSDDDDKLPSNRNAKTVRLKRRVQLLQSDRRTTTHDIANVLRDQLITQPQNTLKGPALWKHQLAMTVQRLRYFLKSLVYQLEPWSGAFKTIEGHFGTATLSYFRFLRWLMFLNLFISLIILCVTLVPFLALKPQDHSDFASSVNGCLSEYHFKAQYFSQNYSDTVASSMDTASKLESVLDILQGTGWLENTELFYGVYFNRTYNMQLMGDQVYNMSLAYLLAVGAIFFLCFLLLLKNSAKGLKESVQTSSGGTITLYCNKLFGAWDFCILEEKSASLKHKDILQDIKHELEYQSLQWKKEGRTMMVRAKLYTVRLLINILVLAILGASLYLVYYTNEQLIKLQNDKSMSDFVLLLLQYLPPITITILNIIVPLIFNKVVEAEDYMPTYRIRMTLARTVLLRLASLGVLMLSLYNALAKHKPAADIDIQCDNLNPTPNITTAPLLTMTTNTMPNITIEPNVAAVSADVDDIQCWETYVGQQIYKLVVLNFIFVIFFIPVLEFARKFIYLHFHKKVKLVSMFGQQEFDLSKSVLDLVYMQTLCWLGLFFCPFIPVMCVVTCFVFFYIQKASMLHNCLPMQLYGTSKSNSLFMMVLLLSFGLAAIPIVYMVSSMQPSQGCGPFRVYSYEGYVMFDAISNLVSSWPAVIREFLFFIGAGGFMAIILFILCMLMYYFWVVGQGNMKMAQILREQLIMEGHDKQFLLARVNEVLSWDEVSDVDQSTIDGHISAHTYKLRR